LTNDVAYYDTELITSVEGFTVEAPGVAEPIRLVSIPCVQSLSPSSKAERISLIVTHSLFKILYFLNYFVEGAGIDKNDVITLTMF
jgi:hypothetical protein